jgi:uncharacterized protein (DUF433 family)
LSLGEKGVAMGMVNWRDHIVCDPAVLGGKPVLKGTRLAVEFVLEVLAVGWNEAAIRENYPNLTDDRVRAVLAYAAEMFWEERLHLLPPETPA